eukprot:symbB.v1.2.030966.t2/scaffold3541.1/size54392/2
MEPLPEPQQGLPSAQCPGAASVSWLNWLFRKRAIDLILLTPSGPSGSTWDHMGPHMGPQLQRNLEELQGLQEELTWSSRPTLPVKALIEPRHLKTWLKSRAKALPSTAPAAGALGAMMGLPPAKARNSHAEGDAALQALMKASENLQRMSHATHPMEAKMAFLELPAGGGVSRASIAPLRSTYFL